MTRAGQIWAIATPFLAAFTVGCGHQQPSAANNPAPASPAAAASPPAAPGARPEEQNRLLEAQWKEVIVKAQKGSNGNNRNSALNTKNSGKDTKDGPEVVAAVKLVEPIIKLFHAPTQPPTDAEKQAAAVAEAKKKQDAKQGGQVIDLAQELRKITPLDVDHIDILDGQVTFVDTSRKERPEIWLHDLQLSVENLTTRVHLTEGRPALLTASGTLARSGSVSVFITANPFEKGLTFSGRAAVVGLQTSELYRFIEPVTDMQAPHGTIDIFVEFDCRNGQLTGGIKPVFKNIEIRPDSKKLLTVLKAWATDVAINLFSDRVTDRNAVATVIPIKGDLNGPDIQLWPAIFGVMRNAFVEGLTSGYAFLPPPTTDKKEGVIKQGVDALTGSGPPKAQPTQQPDRTPPPPPAKTSPTESNKTSPPASP